jgi:uncharacterized repeat protein (TIGR04076 family)
MLPHKEDAEMSELAAKVISKKRTSETHKAGDEFVMGERTAPNACSWALHSLSTFARFLLHGGSFPPEHLDRASIACPDPENEVAFDLRCTSP